MARLTHFPFAFTLIAMSLGAHADDNTPLPDIVVTAARVAQAPREVLGDVTVISSEEIQAHVGETLAQLLGNQPGVQMTSTGGPGQAASLFLRGGSAQQTLVLIDGVRFQSATVGSASLQYLPLAQIDHIEILRGPASGLYGADAVGGVIQIFSKQGGAKTLVNAGVSGGNEGQEQVNAGISGKSGATRYALNIGHQETTAFPPLTQPSPYSTGGGAYYNSNGSFSLSHDLNRDHQFGGSFVSARVSNHYQDMASWTSLTSGSYNYRNVANESSAQVWAHDRWAANWVSRLQFGTSIDNEYNYQPASDNPLTWGDQDLSDSVSRLKTMNQQLSWQNDISVGPGIISAIAETLEQRVSGDTNYSVTRRQVNSLQLGYLVHVGAWQSQIDVRNDHNSQYGSNTNGTAILAWQINPFWQWGGSASTGFRAPSFNDLYYPGYGNPDLKPEKSVNMETFVRFTGNAVQGRLTLFQNRERDLMLLNSATYIPYNVGHAAIRGASLQADWKEQRFAAGGHLDLLNAQDLDAGTQLPRRAHTSAGAYAEITRQPWNLRLEIQSQGRRFDDDANTPANSMGGYAITNILGGWNLNKQWRISASMSNLFNKTYELAKGYNSPPLTYLIGINAQL